MQYSSPIHAVHRHAGVEADQVTTQEREARTPLGAATLVFVRDHTVWAAHRLAPEDSLVVGRGAGADVVVHDDPQLSRRHARIRFDGRQVRVEDLGSRNGTFIDGARMIDVTALGSGETFTLGSLHVAVVVPSRQQAQLVALDRLLARAEALRASPSPFFVAHLAFAPEAPALDLAWVGAVRHDLGPDWSCAIDHGALLAVGRFAAQADAELTLTRALARFAERGLRAGLSGPREGATAVELFDQARRAGQSASPSKPLGTSPSGHLAPTPSEVALLARSSGMRAVAQVVDRVANATINVLLLGETGVGKEVVAHAIHDRSDRREGAFHVVNCGAIPEMLAESVFFGHERGAFTSADRAAKGAFELADGGTLFLDEVGELSANVQTTLLRVLETRRVLRVGGTREVPVDVRLLAATHRDLEALVESGRFRRDLFYRLNAMPIAIPPLRERTEEIDALAHALLEEASRERDIGVRGFDPGAIDWLRTQSWPGNVREMKNLLLRTALLATGSRLTASDLRNASAGRATLPPGDAVDQGFRERMNELEREVLRGALRTTRGNRTAAAKILRMPLRTLVYKLRALGLRDERRA